MNELEKMLLCLKWFSESDESTIDEVCLKAKTKEELKNLILKDAENRGISLVRNK